MRIGARMSIVAEITSRLVDGNVLDFVALTSITATVALAVTVTVALAASSIAAMASVTVAAASSDWGLAVATM